MVSWVDGKLYCCTDDGTVCSFENQVGVVTEIMKDLQHRRSLTAPGTAMNTGLHMCANSVYATLGYVNSPLYSPSAARARARQAQGVRRAPA